MHRSTAANAAAAARDQNYEGFAVRRESLCCGRPQEARLLNRTDRSSPVPGEAEVRYLDGDFRVMRPGAFVRCAVTGAEIPLEELRYWSVDLQEAYASPQAVLQRQRATDPLKA